MHLMAMSQFNLSESSNLLAVEIGGRGGNFGNVNRNWGIPVFCNILS